MTHSTSLSPIVASPETIFALATPQGRSGVAVIRISGKHAAQAVAHFGYRGNPEPRRAIYHSFTLPSSENSHERITLDHGLLIYFPAPHSFTGEDCVEFQLHGSLAVIRKTLAELATLPSFRMAEAGEFARRAFINGKLDLTAAEGLVDLIEAETEWQRVQASRLAQGEAAIFYNRLRNDMMQGLALLEACIDFPDEEIPESLRQEVSEQIRILQTTITQQLAMARGAERIRDGFTVVILGAPNAGKSTLLNALAQREVAIVSERAGTTRDILEVHLDLRGMPVVLLDTAGLRETSDSIEAEGIARALRRAENASLKLVLFDSFVMPDVASREQIDSQTIVVWTKADAEGLKKPQNAPFPFHELPWKMVSVSAKDSESVSRLIGVIEEFLSQHQPSQEAAFVTRQRHRALLEEAAECLEAFFGETDLVLQCECLRRASVAVGKITGKIQVDELLGVIFSSFCIGK
jgi:tRNA modification GTPase